MPGPGYDDSAAKVTLRSGARPRRFKLMALTIFVAAIAVGAGAASLFR